MSLASKGLVYYTNNAPDERIFKACQKQLNRCMEVHGFPIYSISQKPIDFGINTVMDLPSSELSLYKQVVMGLEECKTDIIFMIEHDVLYHPSHFEFVPERHDHFYYNRNEWRVSSLDGKAVFYLHNDVSQLCAFRDVLLSHYKRALEITERDGFHHGWGFAPPMGLSPEERRERKNHYACFMSRVPNLDIRHADTFTRQRMTKDQFRSERSCRDWTEADEVPYWGKTKDRFWELIDDILR